MAAVSMSFEELLPAFALTGTCEVIEAGPTGGTPTNIIRTDQAWSVKFDWATTGPLNFLLSGTWQLRVYLEQMGGGEFDLPPAIANATKPFVSAPNSYSHMITVPANIVPAGIYRLVAAVTIVGPTGMPGPIAGFGEAGLIQFFQSA
jgi:hypothetical protein